jgi:hypothetical protein
MPSCHDDNKENQASTSFKELFVNLEERLPFHLLSETGDKHNSNLVGQHYDGASGTSDLIQ